MTKHEAKLLAQLSSEQAEVLSELIFQKYGKPYKIMSVTSEDGDTSVVVALKGGGYAEVQFPRKVVVTIPKRGKGAVTN